LISAIFSIVFNSVVIAGVMATRRFTVDDSNPNTSVVGDGEDNDDGDDRDAADSDFDFGFDFDFDIKYSVNEWEGY
jgi:hypothetical protein